MLTAREVDDEEEVVTTRVVDDEEEVVEMEEVDDEVEEVAEAVLPTLPPPVLALAALLLGTKTS